MGFLNLVQSSASKKLEVALAGRADALISGNIKHFKSRRGHHNILISSATARRDSGNTIPSHTGISLSTQVMYLIAAALFRLRV